MFTNNNLNSAKCEENKNIIRLSDYYPNNCSEQEYVEVSDEILEAYKSFDETDKRLHNWDRNHRKKMSFDEIYLGEVLEINTESHENTVIGKIAVENFAELCGETVFRRSIKYYLFKKTLNDIAEEEQVSISAVYKSIKTLENILCNTYKMRKD
ncbi:MAG: hypothetical protein NC452_06125 [Eubacterium sp.]|nr:hypothetical protein [Eubacterium sp.]